MILIRWFKLRCAPQYCWLKQEVIDEKMVEPLNLPFYNQEDPRSASWQQRGCQMFSGEGHYWKDNMKVADVFQLQFFQHCLEDWKTGTWYSTLFSQPFFPHVQGFPLKTHDGTHGRQAHWPGGLRCAHLLHTPGKQTINYWKLPFIVDLPIKNGDFP